MRSQLADREILRQAMKLSVPVMLEEALGVAVGYIDAAMVGRLGPAASASVGMTASVTWLVYSPLWAMGIALMSVVSQAFGAGDERTARRAGVQSLVIALGLGLGIGALTVGISPFLPGWMGAEPALHANASAYFRIVCLPMVFRAFLVIFAYVLRAAHEVHFPLKVNIGVNLINVLLNRLLIYGPTERSFFGLSLSIPGAGLGVRGAAYATAISVTLGGVVMLCALLLHPRVRPTEGFSIDPAILGKILRIGIPAALTHLGTMLGHVVFASQVTRLGTTALAAHTIALTAEEAFYIPGYGMQTATATLCGNALGSGDERRLERTAKIMMSLSALLMTLTGAILLLIPGVMMRIFTGDAQVIALGAMVLRLVALSEPVYGIGIILDGVYDGIGETRIPLACSVTTMWGIRIALTYVVIRFLGLGLTAVWACMVANNLTKTALELGIFLSGRWKRRLKLRGGGQNA